MKADDVLKANDVGTAPAIRRRSFLSSLRVLPVLITATVVCGAAVLALAAWQYYMGTPWTRDGAVRAYVVRVAPRSRAKSCNCPIADNQFVHRGDLLMLVDPRNYSIAVRQAQAAVEQAKSVADNANAEMIRREKLNDIAVTMEERQTYISQAATAEASYQSALANLEQARVNFRRTRVRSPVNGYVTNLTAQLGNYADVGARQISVVNSNSYWVDAYFEETALGRIHEGDAATIKLMGYSPLLRGRVQGLARGIDVPNAAPDASGLASVNPIFTFVRLAQRVPVRIHIDEVPEGVKLVAGMTATVQIEPYQAPPLPAPAPRFRANEPAASPTRLPPQTADANQRRRKPRLRKPPAPRALRRKPRRSRRPRNPSPSRKPPPQPTRRRPRPSRRANWRCPPRPPPSNLGRGGSRLPPISRRSKSRSPPIRPPGPPPRRRPSAKDTNGPERISRDRPSIFSAARASRPGPSPDRPRRSAAAPARDGAITGSNSAVPSPAGEKVAGVSPPDEEGSAAAARSLRSFSERNDVNRGRET